jgi:DNA polymerase-3 subunit delta
MEEVIKILNDIKGGNIKPIYFLMGEEAYYIDIISDYIEKMYCLRKKKDSTKPYCTVEMCQLKI